jgi:hypothetical protein
MPANSIGSKFLRRIKFKILLHLKYNDFIEKAIKGKKVIEKNGYIMLDSQQLTNDDKYIIDEYFVERENRNASR